MAFKRLPALILIGMVLSFGLLVPNTFAASTLTSISYASITIFNNNCAVGQPVYRVEIIVNGVADGGSFNITENFSGVGGAQQYNTNRADSFLGTRVDMGTTFNGGGGWTAPGDMPRVFVSATANGVTVIAPTIIIDCTTGTYTIQAASSSGEEEASSIVYPPDNRINWQFGDLYGILYRGTDSTGNPAIDLYCYDGERSWHEMQINEANMSDGMRANDCDVTAYTLPDGSLQININYDGKLYEIECADLECQEATMRYLDPNE